MLSNIYHRFDMLSKSRNFEINAIKFCIKPLLIPIDRSHVFWKVIETFFTKRSNKLKLSFTWENFVFFPSIHSCHCFCYRSFWYIWLMFLLMFSPIDTLFWFLENLTAVKIWVMWTFYVVAILGWINSKISRFIVYVYIIHLFFMITTNYVSDIKTYIILYINCINI